MIYGQANRVQQCRQEALQTTEATFSFVYPLSRTLKSAVVIK